MNIKEFAEKVQTALAARLDRETQITDNLKLNGIRRYGILIMDPEKNASPTVYLEPLFERYQETGDMDAVTDSILQAFHSSRLAAPFDSEWFRDFGQVRTKIFYRLVNYEANREMLEQMPHSRYLDLAKTYCVQYQADGMRPGHIAICHNHLEMWDITQEQLESEAERNTPLLFAPCLRSMEDTLQELLMPPAPTADEQAFSLPEAPGLYVLTNTARTHGAAAICYDGPLKEFAAKTGKDAVILPSSIHETLLLPLESGENLEHLKETVRTVNQTQLDPVDRLSDNVYIYRRLTGQIEIA